MSRSMRGRMASLALSTAMLIGLGGVLTAVVSDTSLPEEPELSEWIPVGDEAGEIVGYASRDDLYRLPPDDVAERERGESAPVRVRVREEPNSNSRIVGTTGEGGFVREQP